MSSHPALTVQQASRKARLYVASKEHWAWLTLFCLIFAPTILWLWQRWTMSIWHNGHGLFIPLVMAFLIRDSLRRDPTPQQEEASAWGFLFLVPGLLLVVIDTSIHTQLLSAFGFLLCLPGLFMLLFGARRARALSFVWVIAFLMLPIPAAFVEGLIVILRKMSAVGSEHVLTLIGIPVLRENTKLVFPHNTLLIGDACSGFSTFYAAVSLSLILGYLTRSPAQQALLLGAAFPCAVACNILRCSVLSLLTYSLGIQVLDTWLHPLSGILAFALTMLVILALAGYRNLRTGDA